MKILIIFPNISASSNNFWEHCSCVPPLFAPMGVMWRSLRRFSQLEHRPEHAAEICHMEGIFDEFLKPESKNMYKKRRNGIYCESCHNQDVESQLHVLVCLAYDKLRQSRTTSSSTTGRCWPTGTGRRRTSRTVIGRWVSAAQQASSFRSRRCAGVEQE